MKKYSKAQIFWKNLFFLNRKKSARITTHLFLTLFLAAIIFLTKTGAVAFWVFLGIWTCLVGLIVFSAINAIDERNYRQYLTEIKEVLVEYIAAYEANRDVWSNRLEIVKEIEMEYFDQWVKVTSETLDSLSEREELFTKIIKGAQLKNKSDAEKEARDVLKKVLKKRNEAMQNFDNENARLEAGVKEAEEGLLAAENKLKELREELAQVTAELD